MLSIGYIELQGVIPEWITNLTQFQVLDLSNNKFHGKIPSTLNGMKGFKMLGSFELGSNTLYEDVRIVIKGYEYVLTYVLATNTIEIPQSIGSLSGLRLLNLSKNQLEGKIPPSFSKISTLD